MSPKMPNAKAGSKTFEYITECHKRIWELARLIDPKVTGDAFEVADKIINDKKRSR